MSEASIHPSRFGRLAPPQKMFFFSLGGGDGGREREEKGNFPKNAHVQSLE